ncbi:glycosyl hydrolase family 76-domain-containing protein [Delphinella strobiligena]|nr:glycosyl hydrolase family 76-domain-containing protein [Delphinella strobiligena]
MKFSHVVAAAAAGLQGVHSLTIDVTSEDSIKAAAGTIAHGLMNYYHNNESSTASYQIGTFSPPLDIWYWWEAGAAWGGLIDYWAYTGDTTYMSTVTEALLAQRGADNDFMPSYYAGSMGNDDQAFWAAAALSALEYGFPEPPNGTSGNPTWQSLAEAVWNNLASRWNTTQCGGGLKWQVYPQNAGYDYKQTISNAGFFQIGARLARFTGNATYYEWSEKTWDWLTEIGLVNSDGAAYDGTNDLQNCSSIDKIEWTYNSGMLLYGAASLYNYTNGSQLWSDRVTTLLNNAESVFFNTLSNSTGVMVEQACEPYYTCDNDQWSFKAYLGRWMGKTSVVAPFTREAIMPLLTTSAQAAAQACSGGTDGVTCGARWYLDGWDGTYGIGQQLSALEVTQALLIDNAPDLLKGEEVKIEVETTASAGGSLKTTLASASATVVQSTAITAAAETTSAKSTPSPSKGVAVSSRHVKGGDGIGVVVFVQALMLCCGFILL